MAHVGIIESDEEIRETLRERLAAQGHTVMAMATSAAAMEAAREHAPDILIADLKTSEGHHESLAELAKDRNLARVPVILLVDPADMSLALSSYQADIYAVLKKPVDVDHLLLQVETLLRQTFRQKLSRKRETSELRNQIMKLERSVRATTEDLTDAAQNFVTMLASPPTAKGLKVDVQYNPSGGFIGGDFYDFFWLDQRRLCTVVGDVSGHGIQAAVIQSMARKVISIGMRIHGGDLRAGLRFANDELADDIPNGKFVAALVGVLDVISGDWFHARCGIPHPVFVNPDGSREDVVTAGVALGLKRSAAWSESIEIYSRTLRPESRVVLFTDGIIECVQEDGQEFDYAGIHRVLESAQPEDDIPELIVNAASANHRADDDVMVICLTRQSPPLGKSSASRGDNEFVTF